MLAGHTLTPKMLIARTTRATAANLVLVHRMGQPASWLVAWLLELLDTTLPQLSRYMPGGICTRLEPNQNPPMRISFQRNILAGEHVGR